MAGIASPSLIREWSDSIKSAIPEMPLVIHSHYTTGFAPLAYMQSIEVGANAVDLSISTLSGRSGHPSMEVFTKVLSDLGYNLGFDIEEAQNAMKEVADLYREYHKYYEFCEMKMAGSVDYRVFEKGIPGGQISIFRNELIRNNLGHLFDKVIDQIQDVRDQVGGVALVTPTSEHVARQSTLNAQDGLSKTEENSRLWPGYSEMLRGVMGRSLSKQDEKLQHRALLEWTQSRIFLGFD
jgi:pyruvate/oxaloacetate carboxyltransferase